MIAHILAPVMVTTLFLFVYVPQYKRCEKEKVCKREFERIKKTIENCKTESHLNKIECEVDDFRRNIFFKRLRQMRGYCAELHALIKNQRQRIFSNN